MTLRFVYEDGKQRAVDSVTGGAPTSFEDIQHAKILNGEVNLDSLKDPDVATFLKQQSERVASQRAGSDRDSRIVNTAIPIAAAALAGGGISGAAGGGAESTVLTGDAGADTLAAAEPGAAEGTGLAEVSGQPSVDVPGSTQSGGTTTVAGGATGGSKGVLDSLKTAATVLAPTMSLISAASGIRASQQMAATAKSGQGTPAVFPPATMPVFGNQQTMAVERASLAEQVRRRGRASTVLTSDAPAAERLGA